MAKQVQRAIGWVAAFLLAVGDVVPAGFEGVCGSGIGRQSWKWRDERCLGFVSGLEMDGRRMRLDIRRRWIRHWTSVYRRG